MSQLFWTSVLINVFLRLPLLPVRYLLKNNVSPDLCNEDGLTALHQVTPPNFSLSNLDSFFFSPVNETVTTNQCNCCSECCLVQLAKNHYAWMDEWEANSLDSLHNICFKIGLFVKKSAVMYRNVQPTGQQRQFYQLPSSISTVWASSIRFADQSKPTDTNPPLSVLPSVSLTPAGGSNYLHSASVSVWPTS